MLALAAAASVKVQLEAPLAVVLVAAEAVEELLLEVVEVALLVELVEVLLDLGAAATRALEPSRARTAEDFILEVDIEKRV